MTVDADVRARCQRRRSRTRHRSNPAQPRLHQLDPTRHRTARRTSPPSAGLPRRLDEYALSTVPATRTTRRPRPGLSRVPGHPANATRPTPSRGPRPRREPAAARTAAQGSSRGRRGTTLCRSTARTPATEPLSCPDRNVSAVYGFGGRPRLGIGPACRGIRPASSRARRRSISIWALRLRRSAAAHRARASWTAGSMRSSSCLRSGLTYRACPC